MKVLLISPYEDIGAPGVRTIAACLKKAGHNAVIVFLRRNFQMRYKDNTLRELTILCKDAELIAISLMTNYLDNAIQLTKHLHKHIDSPIIWGGVHPTVNPNECLDHADMICVGEGEDSMVELANLMATKTDHSSVRNIWLMRDGQIVRNPIRPLIQNLEEYPHPDCDYESHFILDDDGGIRQINQDILERYTTGKRYLAIPTRGCPYGCTYCSNNAFNKLYAGQKILRKRLGNSIIDELLEARKRMPFITNILFDDDGFFSCTEDEIRIFSENYRNQIGLPLRIGGVSPSNLTRQKLELLTNAGMDRIRMGIQTGSEKTRKLYKRSHTNQQVANAASIIQEFSDKIKLPVYDIILDNPWESDDSLTETLLFLSTLPTPYYLTLFSLTLYPGTELYVKAKSEGIITNDSYRDHKKDYYGYKPTYINSLFRLLNSYSSTNKRISTQTMRFLTNRTLRRFGISKAIYLYLVFKLWAAKD